MIKMIEDYIRRTKAKHTVQDIINIIASNHIIVNENGFVVFAWVLDEFHALFAYAAPGKSFNSINDELEHLARDNGIKRIKFSTDRPKIMGRLFSGYKPIATIMSKEVI